MSFLNSPFTFYDFSQGNQKIKIQQECFTRGEFASRGEGVYPNPSPVDRQTPLKTLPSLVIIKNCSDVSILILNPTCATVLPITVFALYRWRV